MVRRPTGDAQEMVRRAEYSLGKAIRKGQAEGSVANASTAATERHRRVRGLDKTSCLPRATDYASKMELRGNGAGIMHLAHPDVTDDDLDAALTEAKAEGNLSRANVVRKLPAAVPTGKTAADVSARMRIVADLAGPKARSIDPETSWDVSGCLGSRPTTKVQHA